MRICSLPTLIYLPSVSQVSSRGSLSHRAESSLTVSSVESRTWRTLEESPGLAGSPLAYARFHDCASLKVSNSQEWYDA
jgi:hypothetical protein